MYRTHRQSYHPWLPPSCSSPHPSHQHPVVLRIRLVLILAHVRPLPVLVAQLGLHLHKVRRAATAAGLLPALGGDGGSVPHGGHLGASSGPDESAIRSGHPAAKRVSLALLSSAPGLQQCRGGGFACWAEGGGVEICFLLLVGQRLVCVGGGWRGAVGRGLNVEPKGRRESVEPKGCALA